jgi:hypothetical protein
MRGFGHPERGRWVGKRWLAIDAKARDGRRLGVLCIIASVACVQLLTAFSRNDQETPPASQPVQARQTGLPQDIEMLGPPGTHPKRTPKDSLIRIPAKAEGIEYLCLPADSE